MSIAEHFRAAHDRMMAMPTPAGGLRRVIPHPFARPMLHKAPPAPLRPRGQLPRAGGTLPEAELLRLPFGLLEGATMGRHRAHRVIGFRFAAIVVASSGVGIDFS